MADFHQQDLADSRFEQVHLQRARFHQVHLNEADFNDVDLTGAQFREVFLKDVVMRGTGLVNVRIEGEIEGLTVNGVDVPDIEGVPRDRAARPSLDEALALRLDRQAAVRRYIDALDDATLASDTVPVEGPGWPEPRSYPVRECLHTVLNEEWRHRQYALRDLAVLENSAR